MRQCSKSAFLEFYKTKEATQLLAGLSALCLFSGFVLPNFPYWARLIFWGNGILLFSIEIYGSLKKRNYIRKAEESGEIDTILSDFSNALVLFDGKLRFGLDYVFCRNCYPVRLNQIGIVHVKKQTKSGTVVHRELIMEDSKKKYLCSCQIGVDRESDEELDCFKYLILINWEKMKAACNTDQ